MSKPDDKHEEAILALTPAYEKLGELGKCDGAGGSEHHRVAREWDEKGRPNDIEAFILAHANGTHILMGHTCEGHPCGEWPKHREIDCPLCEGPLCDLDGDGPNPPKETVFTLTYTHKHGSDVGVYKTYKGAADAAYGLASERVEEWDDEEQKAEFAAFGDEEVALYYFHDVEMECSYGEILEITRTELQS